jgi:hypothetical protein
VRGRVSAIVGEVLLAPRNEFSEFVVARHGWVLPASGTDGNPEMTGIPNRGIRWTAPGRRSGRIPTGCVGARRGGLGWRSTRPLVFSLKPELGHRGVNSPTVRGGCVVPRLPSRACVRSVSCRIWRW